MRLRDANPVFDPAPMVLAEERLDVVEESRPELALTDFMLSEEWCRLLARLDEIQNGTIERIEVRAGIPRRIVFASRLAEEPTPTLTR